MNRRHFTLGLFAAAAVSSAARAAEKPAKKPPVDHSQMDHSTMDHSQHEGHSGTDVGRYAALVQAFAICGAAATECVAHCQSLLASGDKSMGECLKTSLACDALCPTVARLARLNSDHAPAIAKASIAAMQACAEACKPHIEHHAFCKVCYDACGAAIAAAKAV